MSDVLLDGEKVEFAGPPPASLSEVRVALEDALAANGRVLAGLTIDGQPFDESLGNRPLAGTRVEATSLALAAAVAQVGAALAPEFAALQRDARTLACEVLCAPWSDMQGRCVQLVERTANALQRAVEVAAHSGEESAPARAVAALAATVEVWLQSIHQHDAAAVALQLDGGVAPALEHLTGILQGKDGA